MSFDEVVRQHLAALSELALQVSAEKADSVAEFAGLVIDTLRAGGTLFFCGNGGSAADAQHLAAEYLVRFRRERVALPVIALTTDSSVLTAGGNDYGFETVFARQVEALCRAGDLLVLHSTSGNSPNLLRAVEAARAKEVRTVGVLAKGGGALAGMVDFALVIDTQDTARAQEIHLTVGHIVCELVDRAMADGEDDSE